MATRYYTFAPDEYYHVYNRGNSKQILFKGGQDYSRFKKLLRIANTREAFKFRTFETMDIFEIDCKNPYVHIGAYCLMPNHYHLLIKPAQDDGISKFMLKLSTSYALYFNKKYDRVGSLFEGSYRSKHIDSDRYLKYLFAYIHLNPFRDHNPEHHHVAFDEKRFITFPHSSLPDYLGVERMEGNILSREEFPPYFKSVNEQRTELLEWLDYSDNVL